jgi:hypothetical protein
MSARRRHLGLGGWPRILALAISPVSAACGSSGPGPGEVGGATAASSGRTSSGAASTGAGGEGGAVGSNATSSASASATSASAASSGSSVASGSSTSSGSVACGCNGMAGCAVWQSVYVTWYGYNDNSCGTEMQMGCNDIANPGLGPQKHMVATAGAGTYDDPSTAASSDTTDPGHVFEAAGGVTLTPGTLLYNPEVEQYFILEDSCLECGDEYACKLSSDDTDDPPPPGDCKVGQNLHIDFWMGPNDATQPASLGTCEDNATLGMPYGGIGTVIVNPPPDLPVKPGPLYTGTGASGGCFTSQQVNGDPCP